VEAYVQVKKKLKTNNLNFVNYFEYSTHKIGENLPREDNLFYSITYYGETIGPGLIMIERL